MIEINFLFVIVVLILSVVVHEVSHGYVADALGDPTARLAGRLTLNPIRHLDLVGSFIVPAITFFLGGFIFGWAKPVPYNPYNLRRSRFDEAYVAAAGPLSNITIAVFFGLLIRFGFMGIAFMEIASVVVLINLVLAVFNLVPIPPLDGSKILFTFLPYKYGRTRMFFERYGLIVILLFILFFWRLILPLISFLFTLITGVAFF